MSGNACIDGDVEHYSVVIVGGGPHGLAVLSALHEKSFAQPQYRSDSAYNLRVGFNAYKLVGRVAVVDPGDTFMEQWKRQFKLLGINHLRSPLFAHPDAYEEHALMNYAISQGRTNEIKTQELAKSVDMERNAMGLGVELHGLPSANLFEDFCESMAERLPHTWKQGTAVGIHPNGAADSKRFHVDFVSSNATHRISADAVVLALGPRGTPNIPPPFTNAQAMKRVVHTEELFKLTKTSLRGTVQYMEAVRTTAQALGVGQQPVLVIGGGLTAAQAAIAAVQAGAHVVLRSRKQLVSKYYDIESDWLDRRHMHRKRFEFLSQSMHDRPKYLQEAVSGGSVPPGYLAELSELASSTGRLAIEVDPDIDSSVVHIENSNEAVVVNGKHFALVILATGVAIDPLSSCQLIQDVNKSFPTKFADKFPMLDESLRWYMGDGQPCSKDLLTVDPAGEKVPNQRLFVVGAYAAMQLGPGALNLMGAMRGGQLVADELHGLMWKDCRHSRQKRIETNVYAILGIDGDSDTSDDDTSDDNTSEDVTSENDDDVTASATPPHTDPPCCRDEMLLVDKENIQRNGSVASTREGVKASIEGLDGRMAKMVPPVFGALSDNESCSRGSRTVTRRV